MEEELLPFCECGKCGLRVTKKGNRFINGHQNRGRERSQKTKDKLSKALTGVPKPPRTSEHCAAMSVAHAGVPRPPEVCDAISKALFGVPKSPEHIAAIRESEATKAAAEAKRGVPLSPEHIAAVKKGCKNSDAVKTNTDKMRGGNDICDHHYIYDHAHPELYTMKVTRSKHQQIHIWMKKAGIKVPHINLPDENSSETREEDLWQQ